MKRDVDMRDISDGKLYESRDLVRAGCGGCVGCHKCCTGMGDSIILDPLDIYKMSTALGIRFEQMIGTYIELGVVDGVILPHIRMNQNNECPMLNSEKRCSIHENRPGICRLFPLGRIYDDAGYFKYFLQTHECIKTNRSKVKISSWIEIPNIKKYEEYIRMWHAFILGIQNKISVSTEIELSKKLNIKILNTCYIKPYNSMDDFYDDVNSRVGLISSENML